MASLFSRNVGSNKERLKEKFFISFILLIVASCSPETQSELMEKSMRKAKRTKGEKSEFYCQQILEYDSLNTFALNRLGSLNLYDEKALGYFLKSLDIDSTQAAIHYEVGYQYMLRSGVLSESRKITDQPANDKAIQYLTNAIELDSTQSLYFYQRSCCYLYGGQYAKHELDMKKACELGDTLACSMLEKMK